MSVVKPFMRQGHFTQLDNLVVDEIMPRIGPNALRVLLLIIRQTIGRNKKSDSLTEAQICEKTGIGSRQTVRKIAEELCSPDEFGTPLLKRRGTAEGTYQYALNRSFQIVRCSKIEQGQSSKIEHDGCSKIEHGLSVTDAQKLSTPKDKRNISKRNNSSGGGVSNSRPQAREEKTPPPPPRNAVSKESSNPFPISATEPLRQALFEVTKVDPDDMQTADMMELVRIVPWLLKEHGGDVAAAAEGVRRRYTRPVWKIPDVPYLSQINSRMWARLGARLELLSQPTNEVNNGKPESGREAATRERLAIAERKRERERLRAENGTGA